MHFKVSFKYLIVIYLFLPATMMPANPPTGINVTTVTNDIDDSLNSAVNEGIGLQGCIKLLA